MSTSVETPVASPESPEQVSDIAELPRSRRDDWLEKTWRFFCSIKLMVVLMALFAIAMAAGTFLNPKESALAEIEKAFAHKPWLVWAYRTFELYAPFKSWWFTLIIILLALNNLASSLERLPRIFLIVRNPERKLTDLVLRGLRNRKTVPRSDLDAAKVEGTFTKAGYKVTRTVEDGVTYLFGERGAWTRFGVWLVHLALLVICFGGIVSVMFSFEGTMDIPEAGGRRASFKERLPDGTVLDRPLPGFAIQCEKFYLDKFKDGSPRRFASDLVVVDEKLQPIFKKKIIVNDPLDWEGMSFYQATYSERPDMSFALMTLKDTSTGETKEFRATPRDPFALGDGSVQYNVVNYDPNFGELGPAVQVVRREMPKGAAQGEVAPEAKTSAFWVFSNYPEFDEKYRGDRFAVKFDKLVPTYVTGIQVARDPGRPITYLGCVLVWIGLFISFWTAHRRVWARIEDGKVVLAGAAHRNKDQFKAEFDRLVSGMVESQPNNAGA